MDIIFINGLVFSGIHGVKPKEKTSRQNFGIDISFSVDASPAITSDHIEDAVDYGPVRDIIKDTIENRSFNLIETLIDTIAKRILEDTRILSVSITLKKLDIWGNGTPGISVTRINEYNSSPHSQLRSQKNY